MHNDDRCIGGSALRTGYCVGLASTIGLRHPDGIFNRFPAKCHRRRTIHPKVDTRCIRRQQSKFHTHADDAQDIKRFGSGDISFDGLTAKYHLDRRLRFGAIYFVHGPLSAKGVKALVERLTGQPI